MNTEITDSEGLNGILFYDGDCCMCVRITKWVRTGLARRGIRLQPLQTPGCGEQLGLNEAELMAEMWLFMPDRQKFGGADALLEICRHFWWTWPLRQLARFPGVRRWLSAAYRWVARHRQCVNATCLLKKGRVSL